MAREMKDSGIEWIGEIPREWKLVRMKSCILQRDNGAWGNEANGDEQDIICLRVADFNYSMFKFKDTEEGLLTKRNYNKEIIEKLILFRDDIVIEKSGGGEKTPVGRTVIFDKNYRAVYANFCDRLRCRKLMQPQFLQYIFATFYAYGYVRNYIKQTTGIQNLDLTAMLSLEKIAVPSLTEQNNIINFLTAKCNKIDNIINKTRASIEEYKKLKQAVITQAVAKGARGNREMKDSGVEWIGEIPAEWKTIRIKWILNERKEKSENGEEEPLSMSQKYGIVPTKEMEIVPNMASSFIGAKIVYSGDLVFNKLKAHLGVFAVSQYDGLVSPDYAVYYSQGIIDVKYLEYLFKTPEYIAEFKKRSSGVGAGLTRLYTDELYDIYCLLPPQGEQIEIIEYLNKKIGEIDVLIKKKEQYLSEIENYKKSLIYGYVTGKKEVPCESVD